MTGGLCAGFSWFDAAVRGLADRDVLAVLSAVHAVSEARSRDEFGLSALQAVHGLVRSDVTSLNEIDPGAGRVVFRAEPTTFPLPDGSDGVFGSLAHGHPLIRHYTDTGDGSAMKVSDLCTPEAWHDSELYRRFYGPLGLEHQMSIALPAPLPLVVGLAFNRTSVDFGERERAVLNLIRPHLAQSWRRAREYERLDVLVNAATGALAVAGGGVIVLSDPMHELTLGAFVSLYRFYGRPGVRDPLPPRVRRWLDLTSEDNRRGARPGELSRPLRTTLDGTHLTLRLLPGGRGRPDAVLLDEQPVDQPTLALQAAGLTAREVTVLDLVGRGVTNAEIARQLSLSPWTVKRHLANIYAKLGVNGRVRASAAAAAMAAHHRETGATTKKRPAS